MKDAPRYYGICEGGPMHGRTLAHTAPTKAFAEPVNAPGPAVIDASDPNAVPLTTGPHRVTGHYHWSYTNNRWDWRP